MTTVDRPRRTDAVITKRPPTNLRRNPAAPWRHLDVVLLGASVGIAAMGVLMVYAATRGPGGNEPADTFYLKRQAVFFVIGLVVMAVTALIDYRRYQRLRPVHLRAGVVTCWPWCCRPSGRRARGPRPGSSSVGSSSSRRSSPSSALIIGLSALMARFRWEVDVRRLLLCLLVAGLPLGLIMLQPDLGTALVMVAIIAGILLVGGARFRQMGALALLGVLAAVAVLQSGLLEDYQRARLTVVPRPDERPAGRGRTTRTSR